MRLFLDAHISAEARRRHAGCIVLVGFDHSQFGTIIRCILAATKQRREASDWSDLTVFVGRHTA